MRPYRFTKDDRPLREKILEELREGFFDVYLRFPHDTQDLVFTHGNSSEDRNKFVNSTLKPIVDYLEKHKPEYNDFITGEVTSHLKFRAIDFEGSRFSNNSKIVKLNTFYEIENKDKSYFFKGQFGHGVLLDNGKIYLQNYQPKKYCCDYMKRQFKLCENHGLNCPDYFIYHNAGRFYVEANGNRELAYCPFCGTKLSDYIGLFLLID